MAPAFAQSRLSGPATFLSTGLFCVATGTSLNWRRLRAMGGGASLADVPRVMRYPCAGALSWLLGCPHVWAASPVVPGLCTASPIVL